MNQEKIGKFIADMRKKKGITQKEFAEKLGVTDKTVSRWENGLWPYKWHKIKKYKICFILKEKLKKRT